MLLASLHRGGKFMIVIRDSRRLTKVYALLDSSEGMALFSTGSCKDTSL